MITVTTPSITNNLTPMTESGVSSATAVIAPNADFTNALNAQLTVPTNVATPILDETALLAAQVALLTATTESLENNTSNQTTPVLAAPQNSIATTALTTQQPAVLTESMPSATPTTFLTANTAMTLANAPTSELAITNEDNEILSNVTDTLKFIATGTKLGDTLPEGQVIRLQNVNASTPLTQQVVQAAVKLSTNTVTPVNTPATVLAQQAIPVQIGELVSNPQNQPVEVLSNAVVSDIQNEIATETTVDAKKTIAPVTSAQVQNVQIDKPVVTETSVQTQTVQTQIQTVQTEKPIATVAPVQSKIVQAEKSVVTTSTQSVQAEKPAVTTTTPAQAQTVQAEKSAVTTTTPAQAQSVQAEKPVVTTLAQSQAVQTEKPVVTTTSAQSQTIQVEKSAVTATSAQSQMNQTEKPVETTSSVQAQTVHTEKPVSTVTIGQQQNQQTENKPVQEAVTVENALPERSIISEVPVQYLQNEPVKNTLKNSEPVNSDESLQSEESLIVAQALPTFVQNEVTHSNTESTEKISSANTEKQENALQKESVLETPLPLVTAQAIPLQAEANVATFDTPSSSTLSEDKPALTPAKNLLADVLANRNNGGDMANNSGDKKGSDTPANSASLLTDSAVKNTLDNKTFETKSFASLLNTEKSEAASALSATTNEKVMPQVATTVVNKLAQEMKADAPALTRPLSHPNWNQEVGERIIWMNNRGISSAEIRMNPQNLGAITVRIDVDSEQQTSVSFTAQNADVRTALEASIPRLREMLSSQNLNLADVNVSQQTSTSADSNGSQRQNAQMSADASANGQGNRQANQEVDANGNPVRQIGANGEEIAIDEFANGQIIEGNGTNGMLSLFA